MMAQGNISTSPADIPTMSYHMQSQPRKNRTQRAHNLARGYVKTSSLSSSENRAATYRADSDTYSADSAELFSDDYSFVRVTICSFAGAFLSVVAAAAISMQVLGGIDTLSLIVAFGMSAVSIFGLPSLQESRKAARKHRARAVRRMIIGHICCAATGVAMGNIVYSGYGVSFASGAIGEVAGATGLSEFAAMAVTAGTGGVVGVVPLLGMCVATAVFCFLFMKLLRHMHYPALVTALAAATGSEALRELGFWFVAMPVAASCLVMWAVAFGVCRLCGGVKQR